MGAKDKLVKMLTRKREGLCYLYGALESFGDVPGDLEQTPTLTMCLLRVVCGGRKDRRKSYFLTIKLEALSRQEVK